MKTNVFLYDFWFIVLLVVFSLRSKSYFEVKQKLEN